MRSTKQGRVRTWELDPGPLATVRHWLDDQHDLWNRRLDQLDEFLLTLKEKQ